MADRHWSQTYSGEAGATALIAESLEKSLNTPAECGSDGEHANVVDGLFAIAESIGRLAKAIGRAGDDSEVVNLLRRISERAESLK